MTRPCRGDWGCYYADCVPHQAAATQQLRGIRWTLVQCWASVAEHCVVIAQSISWQMRCRLPINTSITVKWVSVRLTSDHSDNIIIWQRRLIKNALTMLSRGWETFWAGLKAFVCAESDAGSLYTANHLAGESRSSEIGCQSFVSQAHLALLIAPMLLLSLQKSAGFFILVFSSCSGCRNLQNAFLSCKHKKQ